jgi:hypothetical protein
MVAKWFRRRILFTTTLLVTGLFVGSLSTVPARAMVGGCMTDPIVVLSNGAELHLYASLPNTPIGDVQSVTYKLVIPVSTFVVLQVSTDGLLGAVEHFQYSATNPGGEYDATMQVKTVNTGDPETATLSLGSLSSSVSGQVYQSLHIHLLL